MLVFNTTNTQTWYKTHLNTGRLYMFSASECQTQVAILSSRGTSGHLASKAELSLCQRISGDITSSLLK
jgi:hypothetical protein